MDSEKQQLYNVLASASAWPWHFNLQELPLELEKYKRGCPCLCLQNSLCPWNKTSRSNNGTWTQNAENVYIGAFISQRTTVHFAKKIHFEFQTDRSPTSLFFLNIKEKSWHFSSISTYQKKQKYCYERRKGKECHKCYYVPWQATVPLYTAYLPPDSICNDLLWGNLRVKTVNCAFLYLWHDLCAPTLKCIYCCGWCVASESW